MSEKKKFKKALIPCLELGSFLFSFSMYLLSLVSLKIPAEFELRCSTGKESNRSSLDVAAKNVPVAQDSSHVCGISTAPLSFHVFAVEQLILNYKYYLVMVSS